VAQGTVTPEISQKFRWVSHIAVGPLKLVHILGLAGLKKNEVDGIFSKVMVHFVFRPCLCPSFLRLI